MEAKELRIGNIIHQEASFLFDRSPEKTTTKAEYKEKDVIVTSEVLLNFNERFYEPIPLTEEWLLKFGWKEIDEKLYCRRWRLKRVDIYKMVSGDYPFYFRYNQEDLQVKSVHQLQNLYFALTGEELTLNK